MIDCALITDDETLRRQVRSLIQGPDRSDRLVLELNESASELPRERVADILAANPRLVIIDLGDSIMGLRVLEVLSQEAPEMALIAAGASLPADSLLRVMRAGAMEYLPRPFGAEDTAQAFQRVRRRLDGARHDDSADRGEITTLFSPKGGVGVTTLGVNLTVTLHELTGKSAVLVDFAPSLGTAALMMGLQPRYSYLDVIQNFHRLDEELFRSFLEDHESGIQVLASPPRAEDPSGPSMDEVMGVLRLCRRHFTHVVVDAGHTLTNAAEVALMEADHRLLVTTPELPTLRNLKRTLEVIGDHAANGKAPPRLLLNQYAEGLGVSVSDVEKGLGLGVDTIIEREDSLIPESINMGRPAVLMRKSSFARSMNDLGERIAGPEHIKIRRDGFLQTLLKPFRSSGKPAAARREN